MKHQKDMDICVYEEGLSHLLWGMYWFLNLMPSGRDYAFSSGRRKCHRGWWISGDPHSLS